MVKDTVNVVRVLQGGPSKTAGILAGDRILIANQDTLFGKQLTSQDIVNTLRGKENTNVDLEVYRPTTKKRFPWLLNAQQYP